MTKVKLPQTILAAGEYDAIQKDGGLYIKVIDGLGASEEAAPATKISRPVVDDTEEEAPAPKRTPKAAAPAPAAKASRKPAPPPAEEEEEEDVPEEKPTNARRAKAPAGPVEVLSATWGKLKVGSTYMAELIAEDGSVLPDEANDNAPYWGCDVAGYDKKSGELSLTFHSDGMTCPLQEGERLFEYDSEIL